MNNPCFRGTEKLILQNISGQISSGRNGKGFFLTSVDSQLEPLSTEFDYTHYLNANLQMSEWEGCNSSHLVSAIMEEAAQMQHSNGCRAQGITRESCLT